MSEASNIGLNCLNRSLINLSFISESDVNNGLISSVNCNRRINYLYCVSASNEDFMQIVEDFL